MDLHVWLSPFVTYFFAALFGAGIEVGVESGFARKVSTSSSFFSNRHAHRMRLELLKNNSCKKDIQCKILDLHTDTERKLFSDSGYLRLVFSRCFMLYFEKYVS